MIKAKNIWDIEFDPRSTTPVGHEEIHPDLIRFKGHFYCGYKEGGRSRVIRSKDGDRWESVKVFRWEGANVADPRMSITAEGHLMVLTSICWGKGNPRSDDESKDVRRQTVTWLTQDGVNWSSAYTPTNGANTILFDATWYNGMGYSLAYYLKDYAGTLYRTRDGKNWRVLARNIFPEAHRHGYEEAALEFDPKDGTAYALVRANPVCAIVGISKGPYYQDWTWQDAQVDWNGDKTFRPASESLGVQLGGPKLLYLNDGRLVAAGRADASTKTENRGRVTLFWIDPHKAQLTPFAKCDGYSHYPGVVEHDNKLWITCGHLAQGNAYNVFLLTMNVPE